MSTQIKHVPTNIITGFLGTGKTSCIQHLLQFKPDNERWAILVNEFGTVGVDATMYQNKHAEEGGVFVREVPGGCMCCVSGLPMQIALNVLLKLSRPHRLLIEPSGLGHPVEVVSMLMSEHYKEVLDIQKILTIIDPRHILDERYFGHPTYQQQLAIADTWVFNKFDRQAQLMHDEVERKLTSLDAHSVNHIHTQFGCIEPDELLGETGFNPANAIQVRQPKNPASEQLPDPVPIPEATGFLKQNRQDEGFHASSWRFQQSWVFSRTQLLEWIKTIRAERIKGVFRTRDEVIGINVVDDQLQIIPFADSAESKLEIISAEVEASWDEDIHRCVISRALESC